MLLSFSVVPCTSRMSKTALLHESSVYCTCLQRQTEIPAVNCTGFRNPKIGKS